jgi:hypothetical protein
VLLAAAVIVGLSIRCGDADGLDETEIECDEAVAHLQSCCTGVEIDVACRYDHSVGCHIGTFCPPDLTLQQSSLLQSMSCDDIQKTGLCDLDLLYGPNGSVRTRCLDSPDQGRTRPQ